MQPSPFLALLLAAAAHAFIGPPPLRCRVSVASDRDGSIDDADEAARVAAFRARLLKGGLDASRKMWNRRKKTTVRKTWSGRARQKSRAQASY